MAFAIELFSACLFCITIRFSLVFLMDSCICLNNSTLLGSMFFKADISIFFEMPLFSKIKKTYIWKDIFFVI